MKNYGEYGLLEKEAYKHGYDEGKQVGFEDGRRKGKKEGRKEERKNIFAQRLGVAFNEELAKTKKESFALGHKAGRKEADGRERIRGYEEGKKEGIAQGREEGLDRGREEGKKEGIAQGREEGFDQGREEGKKEAVKRAVIWFIIGVVFVIGSCSISAILMVRS